MISIPSDIKLKLIELDRSLQELGRMLYGRKLFGDYVESARFNNFSIELHSQGSFTLHFKGNILGLLENKFFQAVHDDPGSHQVLDELELTIALIKNRLKLVSA